MRPSDPIAVSKRFAAVLARGLARADMEITEHFARIRALPSDDRPSDTPPWFKGLSSSRELREEDDAWLDDEAPASVERTPAAVPGLRMARVGRGRRKLGVGVRASTGAGRGSTRRG
jgi:hypothetical protein